MYTLPLVVVRGSLLQMAGNVLVHFLGIAKMPAPPHCTLHSWFCVMLQFGKGCKNKQIEQHVNRAAVEPSWLPNTLNINLQKNH